MTDATKQPQRYRVADFDTIPPLRCPCGWTRRAYGQHPDAPASMHVVAIESDSQTHYHKTTTEIYYVLDGQGTVELDGDCVAAQAGQSVMILPECRHRAVGNLTILNVAVPPFNPDDEYTD